MNSREKIMEATRQAMQEWREAHAGAEFTDMEARLAYVNSRVMELTTEETREAAETGEDAIEETETEETAAPAEEQTTETTDTEEEENHTMQNPITAAIMATVNRIISTQGGYREKHLLSIPHEYERGETWNKDHKVVYVLNKARDLDGYRPGCAVDIVTRAIVG